MDLRYAYKYEENKQEIKIGEEKKEVNERSVPVIPGPFQLLGPFQFLNAPISYLCSRSK